MATADGTPLLSAMPANWQEHLEELDQEHRERIGAVGGQDFITADVLFTEAGHHLADEQQQQQQANNVTDYRLPANYQQQGRAVEIVAASQDFAGEAPGDLKVSYTRNNYESLHSLACSSISVDSSRIAGVLQIAAGDRIVVRHCLPLPFRCFFTAFP